MKLPNHEIEINSCSILLRDIKKEMPHFNLKFGQQAKATNDCDQASDVIVISSEDSAESSDGDEPSGARTWRPRHQPVTTGVRKSPICKKRLWKTVRRLDDSSEFRADMMPFQDSGSEPRSGSDKDPEDIGNQSTWEMSNKKRRINDGDYSELNNREEYQETSSSALRNESGKED